MLVGGDCGEFASGGSRLATLVVAVVRFVGLGVGLCKVLFGGDFGWLFGWTLSV